MPCSRCTSSPTACTEAPDNTIFIAPISLACTHFVFVCTLFHFVSRTFNYRNIIISYSKSCWTHASSTGFYRISNEPHMRKQVSLYEDDLPKRIVQLPEAGPRQTHMSFRTLLGRFNLDCKTNLQKNTWHSDSTDGRST